VMVREEWLLPNIDVDVLQGFELKKTISTIVTTQDLTNIDLSI